MKSQKLLKVNLLMKKCQINEFANRKMPNKRINL